MKETLKRLLVIGLTISAVVFATAAECGSGSSVGRSDADQAIFDAISACALSANDNSDTYRACMDAKGIDKATEDAAIERDRQRTIQRQQEEGTPPADYLPPEEEPAPAPAETCGILGDARCE